MREHEREREQANRATVLRLWEFFDAGAFTEAGELLDDAFVCEWPQSRERIRGRDNYVAVNAHYPGRWRIAVRRAIAAGDTVVTDAALTNADDPAARATAVSFFELREGRILRQTDYWPEPYKAPAWRQEWVEMIDG